MVLKRMSAQERVCWSRAHAEAVERLIVLKLLLLIAVFFNTQLYCTAHWPN